MVVPHVISFALVHALQRDLNDLQLLELIAIDDLRVASMPSLHTYSGGPIWRTLAAHPVGDGGAAFISRM